MALADIMNAIGLRARASAQSPKEGDSFAQQNLPSKAPTDVPIFYKTTFLSSNSRAETKEIDLQQLESKLKSYNLKHHADGKITFSIPQGGSYLELLNDAQKLIEMKYGETWMISRRFQLEVNTEEAEKVHLQRSNIKIELDAVSKEVFDQDEANRLIAKVRLTLPTSLELMAAHALSYASNKDDIFRGNKLLCSGGKVLGFSSPDGEFGGFWVTAMTANTLHFCMPSITRTHEH